MLAISPMRTPTNKAKTQKNLRLPESRDVVHKKSKKILSTAPAGADASKFLTKEKEPKSSINYKSAGVDVEAGDDLVSWIQTLQGQDFASEGKAQSRGQQSRKLDSKKSLTDSQKKAVAPLGEAHESPTLALWLQNKKSLVEGVGGFASMARLPMSPKMKDPILVTCTDGVGTKVKLAVEWGTYKEVAQDCVAMCVNDLICTGGSPALFLDYYACGELRQAPAREFIAGIHQSCRESGCVLVGGETAEMPGVYAKNDFDCAGFAVGWVDSSKTWGSHRCKDGDRVVGVESSGFHSNGFSLLRKVFSGEISAVGEALRNVEPLDSVRRRGPLLSRELKYWRDLLIEPTRLYVDLVEELKAQKIDVHAAAHITGGGLLNVDRVLPSHLKWKKKSWPLPPAFVEVQDRTGISRSELEETLNCGIGFVFVVPASSVKALEKSLSRRSWKSFDLGELTK